MSDGATALVVIDVQVAMFDPDDPVHGGEELLATLGRLLASAREAGSAVVFIQQDGRVGSALAPGAPGHAIHGALSPWAGESVVRKTMPDAFFATELDAVLHRRGVRRLVLCGIQTDLCVDTTCRRACSLGYDVTLVRDGHSTWPRLGLSAEKIVAHHNDILGDWFATAQDAADIRF